jgi:predicted ATP-grasp superfamily ATP-dependent carboligase
VCETERSLVLAGVTTRALAVSAARAGWRVTAVDAFGDLDLRAVAAVMTLPRNAGARFTPAAAARAARVVRAEAAAYTSNFENHPGAVAMLSEGRRLLGNTPQVLEQIRSPLTLMRALSRRGFTVPATRVSPPPVGSPGQWLRKPRRSGGGHGTVAWKHDLLPRSAYLQARIAGIPGSIAFLADGRNALPIGISRQLVGERAFGSRGFRYCGSLLAGGDRPLFDRGDEVASVARALAAAVTEEFGLVGLNGLDFVAREGVPYPIEVNPRYSASMELVERSGGSSLFGLHERACAGVLPDAMARPRMVAGKAVVFARRAVRIGETHRWAGLAIADVPPAGERIARGRPICTVFAEGRDADECRERLVREAGRVYRAVESRARGAA